MQGTQKILSIFLVLFVGLLFCVNGAHALTFEEIQVNGVEYDSSNSIIHADRGDTVDIRVELKGSTEDEERVRVKAWIGGYKYDDVEDSTNRFTVLSDTVYVKDLSLVIPNDIEATGDYTLHVEAYGPEGESIKHEQFTLKITPIEDLLTLQDVMINPGLSVEAGKPVYVSVRVENQGENKQEDIRVKASIPKLGLSARTYIEELVSNEFCDAFDCDDDEETSQTSDELMLKIPENTKEGTYELDVEVEYDRFHKSVKETYLIYVEGAEKEAVSTSEDSEVKRIVNVDTATQEVEQGDGVIYRITLANLGDNTETYNLEVSDVETWGTVRVDPAFVVVNKDSTGEAFVYLAANENAADGLHMFTVKVKSGEEVVKEISLGADVKVKHNKLDLTQALWIVFGVLVLLILILGIILLIKRSGENSDAEEPSMSEGQTYY